MMGNGMTRKREKKLRNGVGLAGPEGVKGDSRTQSGYQKQ